LKTIRIVGNILVGVKDVSTYKKKVYISI